MRRVVYLFVALLLALTALPATGFAINDTPGAAIPLTADNPGHADRLVGNSGGVARFYRVDYAGNGQPTTIQVTAVPGQGVTYRWFGFKMYGPQGVVGESTVKQNEQTWTSYAMTMASSTPGVYLVQVYNFADQIPVDFNIQATGLLGATPATGSAPAAASNATPDRAISAGQPSTTLSGALTGQRDGAFQYFTVEYPGGWPTLTVNMAYSPPSPLQNNMVGFLLWRVGDGNLVARSTENSRDATSATLSASYQADAADTLLVQAFNYQPDLSIGFNLSIDGAGGTLTEATANTIPAQAYVLSADVPAMRGTVPAGLDATFHFYLLNSPGGNKEVTVGITADEDFRFTDQSIGFNLFKGADLAAQVNSHRSDRGNKRIAYYTIKGDEATTYGIQVFNYTKGLPLHYAIYVTGLK